VLLHVTLCGCLVCGVSGFSLADDFLATWWSMPNPTERFSLRLAREHLKLLQDQAEALGTKPSSLASELLVRALTDAKSDELRSEVEQMRKDLQRMWEDIANLGVVLLVKAAHEDPEKARAWVRKNFRP
jgi:hypothetical protein